MTRALALCQLLEAVPVALPFALQAYIRLGGFSGEDAIDAKNLAEEGTFETGE